MFLRLIFVLIGLTLTSQTVFAIVPPAAPEVNSPYVQELFGKISDRLVNASSAGPSNGSDYEKKMNKVAAAARLRSLFVDLPGGVIEPGRDINRTACFVHDIRAMEEVLAQLIDGVIASAENLDYESEELYFNEVAYLWEKIRQVREFALDPTVQIPVKPGTGTGSVPRFATPSDDDALCPYTSDFAPLGIDELGCTPKRFTFYDTNPVLTEDANLFQQILLKLGSDTTGISQKLLLYRNALKGIWSHADAFVKNLHPPSAPAALNIIEGFTLFNAFNEGESGCRGWPSDALDAFGDPVSGENITLQNYFPSILSRELADAFEFLKVREGPAYREYVRDLNQRIEQSGGGYAGYTFSLGGLDDINREHVTRESHLILSIRDPQVRMENLANDLHLRTREFASQAVSLEGQNVKLPPLRKFIMGFTEFLSRMCENRGCTRTILRSLELSLTDDCYNSFRSAIYFKNNPSEATLPVCKARYVDR